MPQDRSYNIPSLTRAMSNDGSVRLIFAETAAIVQRAHEIHDTSKTVTAALGRVLTAASMMGSLLKNRADRLTIQINGGGEAGMFTAIADYAGNVRGRVESPCAELPPNAMGKLDVGGVVAGGEPENGILTVIRDTGGNEPYVGISRLVSGEIAEDITEYFAVSEQTPTVCALGVLCDTDISVKAAGGFLLQLMPNCDETIIPILEANIAALPPVTTLLRNALTPPEIMKLIFGEIEFDIFDSLEIGYVCPCSRDSYIRALIGLGTKELSDMIADGKPIETRCRYCGKTESFSVEELNDMLFTAMNA